MRHIISWHYALQVFYFLCLTNLHLLIIIILYINLVNIFLNNMMNFFRITLFRYVKVFLFMCFQCLNEYIQKSHKHFDDSSEGYQKAMLQFMNDYHMRFHVTKSVQDVLSIKNSLFCQCVIVTNRHFLFLVQLRNTYLPNYLTTIQIYQN